MGDKSYGMSNEKHTKDGDEAEVENIDMYTKLFGLDANNLKSREKMGKAEPTNDELYNEKNPATGLRYDIPMLSTTDPDYAMAYARMMRLKRTNSTLFDKIMNWD